MSPPLRREQQLRAWLMTKSIATFFRCGKMTGGPTFGSFLGTNLPADWPWLWVSEVDR